MDYFKGLRDGYSNETYKENNAIWGKTDYQVGDGLLSGGVRFAKVDYKYESTTLTNTYDESLKAFDVGYNYKIDAKSSLFVNYNRSYQAPDIDRFFNIFTGAFNGFIEPMKVSTLNVGYNHFSYPNKLKVTLFRSVIDDEVYYNSATWTNTNYDKTRKTGIEIYDSYALMYNLYASLNYTYVDTKKKEDDDNSVEGNEIPGVSAHILKIGLTYNPTHRINLSATHTYRSSAYAADDNDHSYEKMDSYSTTDISASYKYKKFEVYAKVDNLFDRKNALFADSGFSLGVYPVNYERTFMIGLRARF